jgi:5-oxoprolinase (ATP-hydrolysing) subunit A
LMGLSGSHSIKEAALLGLRTASEVFADRRYEEDGSLRSRKLEGAVLTDVKMALEQVVQMVTTQTVTAISGRNVPVAVDTICIHGDGAHAVEFAQQINQTLKNHSIDIQTF